jgi:hypothetical protein
MYTRRALLALALIGGDCATMGGYYGGVHEGFSAEARLTRAFRACMRERGYQVLD